MADTEDVVRRALAAARAAREHAHAPHSSFRVGAAVWTADGRIFTGCNVESASYGLTLCAERAAIANYVAATPPGARGVLRGVALVTDSAEPTPPCGACRQWLVEWAPDGTVVSEGAGAGGAREGAAGGGGGGGSPPQDTGSSAVGAGPGGADAREATVSGPAGPDTPAGVPRRIWSVRALLPDAFDGTQLPGA